MPRLRRGKKDEVLAEARIVAQVIKLRERPRLGLNRISTDDLIKQIFGENYVQVSFVKGDL